MKEISQKNESQYFPLTQAKHKASCPQIHRGLTLYKTVESKNEEHGLFVLSVVQGTYFG